MPFPLDERLFHFINFDLTNHVFDFFFPWFTNIVKTPVFKFFVAPLGLVVVFYFRRLSGVIAVATGALGAWGTDLFAANFIKPVFLRPRPFDAGIDVILRIGKPSGTSFPSSHSLDAFFLAMFFALVFPKLRWVFFLIATLIAFSRIYCGVHYPVDVIGGALIGCALGFAFAKLYFIALAFSLRHRRRNLPS